MKSKINIASHKKKVSLFFSKIRKDTQEIQIQMAKDCLDELFEASPHAGAPSSDFSKSEYDANHKLIINNTNISVHNSATHSQTASRALLEVEKLKADQIKCGDSITITNTTPHALDVEIGPEATGNLWLRPGYFPYQIAKNIIKNRNKDVLK